MTPNDRVFLLRQGRGVRGLVGVGTVTEAPQEAPHWDSRQQADGKTSWIVQVRWTAIATEPFIELADLKVGTSETQLWSTQVGGVTIQPSVRGALEEMWPSAWERHRANLSRTHISTLTPKRLIARLDPDLAAAADDCLDVQPYIEAFARVAASRELTPPLSVGIFGDWGSGKSFFMGRIEDEIRRLTDGGQPDDQKLYVPEVCHVHFNAWHYAETDLWASLVSTIFKELHRFLDPENDTDEFNELLNRLEISKELRKDAVRKLDEAEKDLEKKKARVNTEKAVLEQLPQAEPPTADKLRAILTKSVNEVLEPQGTAKDLATLLGEAFELTGDDAFKKAGEQLTAEGSDVTVEQARDVLQEVRAVASRTGFWWRLLTTAKLYRTWQFWVVLAVAVLIPIGYGVIQTRVDFPVGWPAGVLEVVTVLGAVLAWARATLARAAPVFTRLDRIQASIEHTIEDEQSALRQDYEDALKAEGAAQRTLAEAVQDRDQAENDVQAARVAVRESTSQARLGRFIRDRASSADYDKYLGLIAMVHRDFGQLSTLMRPSGNGHDPTLPRVDRIILYIDDLDRCYPPKKVVRVLEAVHLLLFFPLFVVFVGVDSRWVSRSLNQHFDQMLRDEAATPDVVDTSAREPANSHDFLEKIFQVPFWLRRMDPRAVRTMIHQLINAHEVESDDDQLPADDVGDSEEVGDADEVGADHDAAAAMVPASAHSGAPGAVRLAAEAEAHGATIGEPIAPPAEALRIRSSEIQFMDKVAPLMPRTPRAIKRFVNIYRLYKATLSTPGLESFLGTPADPGNYRAVQVLLALVTGTPDFAKAVVEILDTLEDSSIERLSEIPAELPFTPAWQTTLTALKLFAVGQDDLELTSLRDVAPLVTRYSLHHMVSALPGEATPLG
jgi:hypothetical protein